MQELKLLQNEIERYLEARLLYGEESIAFDGWMKQQAQRNFKDVAASLVQWLKSQITAINRGFRADKKEIIPVFAAFIFKVEVILILDEHSVKNGMSSSVSEIKRQLLQTRNVVETYQLIKRYYLTRAEPLCENVQKIYSDFLKNGGKQGEYDYSSQAPILPLLAMFFAQIKQDFKAHIADAEIVNRFTALGNDAAAFIIMNWIKQENKKLPKNAVEQKRKLAEFYFKLKILLKMEGLHKHISENCIRDAARRSLGIALNSELGFQNGAGRLDAIFRGYVEKLQKKQEKYLQKLSKIIPEKVLEDKVATEPAVVVQPKTVEPDENNEDELSPVASLRGDDKKEDKVKDDDEQTYEAVVPSVSQLVLPLLSPAPKPNAEVLQKEIGELQYVIGEVKAYFLGTMDRQLADRLAKLRTLKITSERIAEFEADYHHADGSYQKSLMARKIARRFWDYIPFGNWVAKRLGYDGITQRGAKVQAYLEAKADLAEVRQKLDPKNVGMDSGIALSMIANHGYFKGVRENSFNRLVANMNSLREKQIQLAALSSSVVLLEDDSDNDSDDNFGIYHAYNTGSFPVPRKL